MGCAPAQGVSAAAPAFVPTDISGLALWLDASDETTLFTDAGTTAVTADGDAVYQWNDKSGNARHVSQTTAGNRPLYKTGVLNSKSVLRFDGTNDKLSVASYDSGASWTRFVVVNGTTGYGYQLATPIESYIYVPGGAHFSATGVSGESQFDVTVSLTGAWKILSHRCDGTHAGHISRNNGTDLTRGTVYASSNPGNPASATLNIGGGGFAPLAGDIAEVIFYDSVLSEANITSVESYLASKWGI